MIERWIIAVAALACLGLAGCHFHVHFGERVVYERSWPAPATQPAVEPEVLPPIVDGDWLVLPERSLP